MTKVCWISNAPSPYKVLFMNALGKEVDLTCLFETRAESDRQSEWYDYNSDHFRSIYLPDCNQKNTIGQMSEECDCLINSDYSKRICMYAVKEFHKHKKPAILHADGGLAISRGILDFGISAIMKQNDWFLSSGIETNKYFRHYGVPEDRIFTYHFACMTEKEIRQNGELAGQKKQLRSICGFNEEFAFFSVGQQIRRKGYDVLAKAMIGMPESIGVYIAGGEPLPEVKKIIDDYHLEHIHFIGFHSSEELRRYYAAADAFVLPTRYDIWGLVINEAMSFGLPVIATDQCVAAKEFSRNGASPIIIQSEDDKALAESMIHLSSNELFRNSLRRTSLDCIREYSIESMCRDFCKAIHSITEASFNDR